MKILFVILIAIVFTSCRTQQNYVPKVKQACETKQKKFKTPSGRNGKVGRY